jgi:hypothetical protein
MRLYNVTYFGKNGKSSYGGFPLVFSEYGYENYEDALVDAQHLKDIGCLQVSVVRLAFDTITNL